MNNILTYKTDAKVLAFTAGRDAELPCEVTTGHQVHSDEIAVIRQMGMTRDELQGYDAYITNLPGCCIAVRTADCIPVLLWDPVHHAVAAVHAGWKGTVLKISQKAIARMSSEYGTEASALKAIIGPGICKDCFQVGPEVVSIFKDAGFPMEQIHDWRGPKQEGSMAGGDHIDLFQANRFLLEQAGVLPENIQVSGLCTYQDPHFYSARREGAKCGRNISGICLLPDNN